MPRIYAGVTGSILIILGALGLIGFAINATATLYQPVEIVIHLVFGVIALVVALTSQPESPHAILYGRVAGIFFLLFGIVGYPLQEGGPGSLLYVGPADNIVHIIFGLWGIFVGYFARRGWEAGHPMVAMAGA